jgi:hypothetical protein
MMDAVHRYEGTVNQVMGDGIMALFGAPIAHEDHAVRACYAALAMQSSMQQYATEMQRTKGVPLQIRVGLNSGEVVVRSIGSDLHMDYTVVGQTTHLAAHMEQMARPGSILITAEVLRLEGYVQVDPPRTNVDKVLVLRYSCHLRHDHAQGGRAMTSLSMATRNRRCGRRASTVTSGADRSSKSVAACPFPKSKWQRRRRKLPAARLMPHVDAQTSQIQARACADLEPFH